MGQVSFWGVQHGLGVTSNTAALAALIGMEYELKTLISQPQWSDSTLERSFSKSINHYNRQFIHVSGTGMDALERAVRSNKLERETIKNHTLVIERDRLDLLSGTEKSDKLRFESSIDVFEVIFEKAQEYYETILLDVHSGMNSPVILNTLQSSDLIVVCLNQNVNVLEKYFLEHQQAWSQELQQIPHIVLISQYDADSKYKLRNIAAKYKYKGKIAAIPYNTSFRDCLNDGDVKGFFTKNKYVTKGHENYDFIQEVRRTAQMILTEIGINPQVKFSERRAL
ncbi:MinD-like ATPase involved in chromosome partitioning or flagellar assembly [Paenibacillus anaericanus]|uniref:hypothetical protein n=1 Tax=Paenibacillus anaericanus TaxID=170367 RepID=UPI002781F6DD|nr:hypothetical protein [Paenibacillus anaericanus]MDQ0087508.1 MinD-like ATPase involved in chromosome partitioning or flagellar assembly [Paenibacillus anaericanus]